MINIRGVISVAALLFALGNAPAHASYLYSYESSNFGFIQDGDAVPGTYTTSQHLSVSFVLSQALGPSASVGLPSLRPVDFSFSDGRGTLPGSDPSVFLAFFSVGTDASGNIAQWMIIAYDHLFLPSAVGEQTHEIIAENIWG